jgi:predicted subunit of tRNA(5-methylaminomethyl-2-thiouridylate) methyltransferase
MVVPRYDSAVSFIFRRTVEEVSSGDYDNNANQTRRNESVPDLFLPVIFNVAGQRWASC